MLPVASRLPANLADLLQDTLLLLAATAGLWLLYLYARVLLDAVLFLLWGLLALVLTVALSWRAWHRRQAFLLAYVAPSSPLQHWLRGRFLLVLRQIPLALLLALLLALNLLRAADVRLWLVLIATPLVLLGLQRLLGRILRRHLASLFLPLLVWRLSSCLVAGLLLGALVTVSLTQAQPDFTQVSLERAVWYLAGQEYARSDELTNLLQFAAALEGLRLWVAQQLLPVPGLSWLLQLSGWLIVFIQEALFVWSYLLFCNGVLMLRLRSQSP